MAQVAHQASDPVGSQVTGKHDLSVKDTGRLDAFSDGVIGIAMTLLVIELHVPNAEEAAAAGGLGAVLLANWPSYFAFIVSFLTILIMWINHHRLTKMIYALDHSLLVLNGLLLMGITLVPFSTALLADYLREPDAPLASAVYSGVLFAIAIFYQTFWSYAARKRRLIGSDIDQKSVDAVFRQYRIGPLFYLSTLILSFISVPVSVLIVFGLAVYFALPLGTGDANA